MSTRRLVEKRIKQGAFQKGQAVNKTQYDLITGKLRSKFMNKFGYDPIGSIKILDPKKYSSKIQDNVVETFDGKFVRKGSSDDEAAQQRALIESNTRSTILPQEKTIKPVNYLNFGKDQSIELQTFKPVTQNNKIIGYRDTVEKKSYGNVDTSSIRDIETERQNEVIKALVQSQTAKKAFNGKQNLQTLSMAQRNFDTDMERLVAREAKLNKVKKSITDFFRITESKEPPSRMLSKGFALETLKALGRVPVEIIALPTFAGIRLTGVIKAIKAGKGKEVAEIYKRDMPKAVKQSIVEGFNPRTPQGLANIIVTVATLGAARGRFTRVKPKTTSVLKGKKTGSFSKLKLKKVKVTSSKAPKPIKGKQSLFKNKRVGKPRQVTVKAAKYKPIKKISKVYEAKTIKTGNSIKFKTPKTKSIIKSKVKKITPKKARKIARKSYRPKLEEVKKLSKSKYAPDFKKIKSKFQVKKKILELENINKFKKRIKTETKKLNSLNSKDAILKAKARLQVKKRELLNRKYRLKSELNRVKKIKPSDKPKKVLSKKITPKKLSYSDQRIKSLKNIEDYFKRQQPNLDLIKAKRILKRITGKDAILRAKARLEVKKWELLNKRSKLELQLKELKKIKPVDKPSKVIVKKIIPKKTKVINKLKRKSFKRKAQESKISVTQLKEVKTGLRQIQLQKVKLKSGIKLELPKMKKGISKGRQRAIARQRQKIILKRKKLIEVKRKLLLKKQKLLLEQKKIIKQKLEQKAIQKQKLKQKYKQRQKLKQKAKQKQQRLDTKVTIKSKFKNKQSPKIFPVLKFKSKVKTKAIQKIIQKPKTKAKIKIKQKPLPKNDEIIELEPIKPLPHKPKIIEPIKPFKPESLKIKETPIKPRKSKPKKKIKKIRIKTQKKKRKLENKNQLYYALVKEKGQFLKTTVNPLGKIAAINSGAYITNNSSAASYKVVKAKKRGKSKSVKQSASLKKFRSSKTRNKQNIRVEKRKYRIDTKGEKAGITAKGLIAKRRKALRKKQTKKTKTKKKKSKKRK